MTIHRLLVALGLALVVIFSPSVAAMPPTGRRISGTVQKTNPQAREAEISRTDTGEPLRFVWINRTIFVVNRLLEKATILEPGAKVEVVYHQPFFGRPFVTRVTLLSASAVPRE